MPGDDNPAAPGTGGGSAITSDPSTNLANVIRGLKKFDGTDPAEFKTWMKKFCVVVGVSRKDILPLLKKERKPGPMDTDAFQLLQPSEQGPLRHPFPPGGRTSSLVSAKARGRHRDQWRWTSGLRRTLQQLRPGDRRSDSSQYGGTGTHPHETR